RHRGRRAGIQLRRRRPARGPRPPRAPVDPPRSSPRRRAMDAEKINLMLRMLPDGVSRRDFLRTAAAGAAGAAGALAAPERGRAQTPKKGGALVYGMEGPSDILDPQATGCWLTYRVTFQMFEGLLAEDLTRADVAIPPLVPKLAESYTVAKDGLPRTFKLRKGVKFHDGTP